ncbi:MAG TPA: class I SAM-dependent methyltransferase [Rhodanobacter sp.]|nr:class I SAM-dependent methyltransferase [Rhodanobacter sp.]
MWLVDDILQVALPAQRFDLWHDRALFHFLAGAEQRARYAEQITHALKPGGHAIIATFGPQGPGQCCGLDTVRYDAASLQRELGPRFDVAEYAIELYRNPFDTTQQFVYSHCRMV